MILGTLLAIHMLIMTPAFRAHAASYVVSNLDDSGPGSLRAAITAALASPEDDTITFSVSGTINLATKLPVLTSGSALTIDGTGQNIIIRGPGEGCSTMPNCRVFASIIKLNLINLTITNGYVNSQGAAILNYGTLHVTDCTISGNISGNGGAILNLGIATIINSTISGNSGGGIINAIQNGVEPNTGILTVLNSTISGNTGGANTAGIGNLGFLTVTHSTIANHEGFGIFTGESSPLEGANTTLQNTIVANNGVNCGYEITPPIDGSYNLVWGDDTCPGINADPKLLALADNGGPTWTHALGNGSAAQDQIPSGINGCGTTYTTDQRGAPRPAPGSSSCDIGSFEKPPATAVLLTKAVASAAAKPGDAITYTITFSNTSVITTTDVLITDTLPAPITNPGWRSSGVTLTPIEGQTYAWRAPDLLPGEGGVITITGVLTRPLAAGVFTNTVTLAVSGTVQTAEAPLTVEQVAPVADAGADQTVGLSQTVTLYGSGTDDNGDALTYGWTQTGGPAVTLSDPAAQQPTFTAPSATTVLTFTLTVTDTAGLSDTDDVVVNVKYVYYWPIILKDATP